MNEDKQIELQKKLQELSALCLEHRLTLMAVIGGEKDADTEVFAVAAIGNPSKIIYSLYRAMNQKRIIAAIVQTAEKTFREFKITTSNN